MYKSVYFFTERGSFNIKITEAIAKGANLLKVAYPPVQFLGQK